MNRKWITLTIFWVLFAVIVGACGAPTPRAGEGSPLAPTDTAVPAPDEVRFARDKALAYLRERYGDQAPAADLVWAEGRTSGDVPGWTEYEFQTEGWVVTVGYAVVPPEQILYGVAVMGEDGGFQWEGRVNAAGRVTEAPEPLVIALDAALAYLRENYPEQAPAADLAWAEQRTTPEGLVGSESFQYAAGGWVITVSYPVVRPDLTVYTVVVVSEGTGFRWQGEVDAAGQVKETTAPSGEGIPVVAWYGLVVGLPAGAQYDDYLSLAPEGAGEVGVEGADETLQSQIEALRDSGSYAHFWGTLSCDVPDYGSCQLLVTRLRPEGPGPLFEPEPVEGWEGTIVGLPADAQFDDAFVLAGDFRAGYGIDSLDSSIAAQLAELRDTGTTVRVWGELTCPAIDSYGTQIQVKRVEVGAEGEAVEGWVGTIVKLPPGSQFGHYFERDDGQCYDIGSTDGAVSQQIVDLRWTGAQVQVWGRLYTGVPAAEARHIEVERIEAVSGPATELRNLSFFASVSASSELPADQWGTYHAFAAVDGAPETSWVEGVEGAGVGEWIELVFPGAIVVGRIGLDIGYDKDADLFFANNRVKRATIVFSDGQQLDLTFADTPGSQLVEIDSVQTSSLRLIVEEVYPGSRYDDTCLSEIEVWGVVP